MTTAGRCYSCGRDISLSASVCPGCGASEPNDRSSYEPPPRPLSYRVGDWVLYLFLIVSVASWAIHANLIYVSPGWKQKAETVCQAEKQAWRFVAQLWR